MDNEFAVAVPAFAEAGDADAVRGFAADHGWPVIVTPRIGSSSDGVMRLEGPADVAAVSFDTEPLLVQAYGADARAIHMAFPPAQGEVFAPGAPIRRVCLQPTLDTARTSVRHFTPTADKSVILGQRRKPAVSTR